MNFHIKSFDWQQNPVFIYLLILSGVTFICSFEPLTILLAFERTDYQLGQVWRAGSAWLTHLNLRHWFLNQWGIVVMFLLLPKRLTITQLGAFALIWLGCASLLVASDYSNYTGLSGVLYGWLLFSCYLSPNYSKAIKAFIFAILSLKVLSENGYFPLAGSNWVGDFIDGQVAHKSHLWGLISGWFVISLFWIVQQLKLMRERRVQ